MRHTQHNDPFDYDHFKDESFWDFSWENDKWLVALVAVMVVAVTLIFLLG